MKNKLVNDHKSEWLGEDSWVEEMISDKEANFLRYELSERSKVEYIERLEMIGFVGKRKILDLACGAGQWSLAMGKRNLAVLGVDKLSMRLVIGREIALLNKIDNVQFKWGHMEDIPADDCSFDAVFCYGAFMFSNNEKTLKEIWRVTEPGALIYINANGWGWYMHRFIKALRGKIPRKEILGIGLMVIGTLLGKKRNIIYTPELIRKRITEAGFEVLEVAGEGKIGGNKSFYNSKFYRMNGIFEILAQKPCNNK
jgi:ubiquinone/menaquinone biosynthesis C-methylase UbiE